MCAAAATTTIVVVVVVVASCAAACAAAAAAAVLPLPLSRPAEGAQRAPAAAPRSPCCPRSGWSGQRRCPPSAAPSRGGRRGLRECLRMGAPVDPRARSAARCRAASGGVAAAGGRLGPAAQRLCRPPGQTATLHTKIRDWLTGWQRKREQRAKFKRAEWRNSTP